MRPRLRLGSALRPLGPRNQTDLARHYAETARQFGALGIAAVSEQPYLFGSAGPWIPIRDGDTTGMAIFMRHYTARSRRKVFQFVGPGEKEVLITEDAKALFVWRKFISEAGETGVNCAVFRNDGSAAGRSSDLIDAAVEIAWRRWPRESLYTYVDPAKVRSRNPGWCFICAGWRKCRVTPKGKLVFERLPKRERAAEVL